MKTVLPSLIGESQSTFVLDKLITDNTIIVFEFFHHMKQKKKGTKGIMALKLHDLKHYDRVEKEVLRFGWRFGEEESEKSCFLR